MSDRKGSLYYMTVNEFFSEFMKSKLMTNPSNFEVIVISKDIIADQRYTKYNNTMYESRYDNINFALELFPNMQVLEYLYGASIDDFALRYKTQLSYNDQMKILCSIVDLVVNDGVDVIMICSNIETRMYYMDILADYMYDSFGIIVNKYSETKGSESEFDYGNFDKIRLALRFHIENLGFVDDTVDTFFNTFVKDMAEEYRQLLMKKSIDELFVIGTNRGVYVNRHKPKEFIVDHILKNIMGEKEQ